MNKPNINIKKDVRSILPLSVNFDDINNKSGYYKVLWGNSMWESGGIYKGLKAFDTILPIQYKSLTWKELIDELRSSIRYLVYTVDGYNKAVGVFSIDYNYIFYVPKIKKYLSKYTLNEYELCRAKNNPDYVTSKLIVERFSRKLNENKDDSVISNLTCLESLVIKNLYAI